ncbi:hypothetical protein CFE70_008610 [Pyrenophora teres f. teres 0-1]|uniref:Uncharacterized protein n=2 Tax=Pyrenophora teres f. teres TaxID=97479 RepID=E3S1H2_PYRTT|nr:hypothetical protein PTT_16062 [Pyrenophora teres f. teres 0-1]KAE8825014.1 hypothetical protein PTNB85_09778 [Pyrenophora teres f. teres]CAA9965678.1 hypothetical protein PTMSG1_09037 [Pyrenophora teres f. maculata]KAE8831550.1 hypothetical protein HRS9139_05792 [Pyrenophora teres f. teres]KAE8835713.1 hypothetical protein HRS9122_07983 [Pyrenophora teres f. teres]
MAVDSCNDQMDHGSDGCGACCDMKDGPTPTPRSHNNINIGDSYIQQSIEVSPPPRTPATTMTDSPSGPHNVYIVTDTCYPTAHSFESNIGITQIISVHSTRSAANSRAKKMIYDNENGCTVDLDKVIEEVKKGLYTGIGVGGEEKDGCCFARKCEVEGKIVDEDSDSEETSGESGESGESDLLDGMADQDGDMDMR